MDSLDDLFDRLRTAASPAEIEALQDGIWQLWLTTAHPLLDKYLEAGMRALSAEEYTLAIREFTELTVAAPEYAEGWNKRATAYYLRGEFKAALRDVAETLRHEPRHFGALSGWATILRTIGDNRGALRVLQRLEKLCPHWPGLQNQLRDLRDTLED
ncbi:tetratricopeptide repeat protein [Hymenobacter sp. 102]|uniref:tetratricopeptide repeat protein n=1 Tax=Hymenobacter sp. 102 TaxID=3403152 RepID=UPI003CEB523A